MLASSVRTERGGAGAPDVLAPPGEPAIWDAAPAALPDAFMFLGVRRAAGWGGVLSTSWEGVGQAWRRPPLAMANGAASTRCFYTCCEV
jgi:hypothetical protein